MFTNNTSSMKKKHIEEIKKNAKYRLTKNQAIVFDTGIIDVRENEKYVYSIMNFINGITLKEWLDRKKQHSSSVSNTIEINAALGFLYAYYKLLYNDYKEILVHGDLNEGNIIFLEQRNYSAGSDDFLRYCSSFGDYLVPTEIEFIDYGTSKWEETTPKIGIQRDLKFIMKNTKSILSSYPIDKFIDYNSIINQTDEFKKCNRRHYLIVDLIRIILSIQFLDNLPSMVGFESQYAEWLRKLWYHDFKWDDKFELNNFMNLYYWHVLKRPSTGGYINEKSLVDYMNKSNEESYEIKFKKKFEAPIFIFK